MAVDDAEPASRVINDVSASTVGNVVQAGMITGGVHFVEHLTIRASEPFGEESVGASQRITIYVSAPEDVTDEREALLAVVRRLQYDPFIGQVVDLRVSDRDNDAAPVPMLASEHPQLAANAMLPRPSQCDVVIAVLWSQLGPPMPGHARHQSSTAWEIEDGLAAHRPDVVVYNKLVPAAVSLDDPQLPQRAEQFEALQSYLRVLQQRLDNDGLGMVQRFETLDEFRSMVDAHLRHIIARRLQARSITADRRTPAVVWDASISPYPGLVPFTSADHNVFFGRDAEVDLLVDLVRNKPLTTVIGSSGVGKSSLIGAGLVTRLATADPGQWIIPTFNRASNTWRGARITPGGAGGEPLQALAVALDSTMENAADGGDETGEERCRQLCEKAVWASGRAARLLIVIDQFEEVFSTVDDLRRGPFIDALVRLADDGLATVVLSLREDFLGRALQSETLARHLQRAMLPLGPPGLSAVTEMVTRPAAVAGLRFDEDLPELLLVQTRQEPGRLPLLAFALNELYRRRDGDRLTMEAHRAIGGVEGAIGHLAERSFSDLEDEVRAELPATLRQLVEVDEVGGPVRSKAQLSALCAAPNRRALVDALIATRLLVVGSEHGQEPFVELAHEAIFRGWPRLAEWIDSAHDDMVALNRMRRAAAEWQQAEQHPQLVWPQERMDQVHSAAARLDTELADGERAFLRPEAERVLEELGRSQTTHVRRREIATRLAHIGDSRPGVGVRADGVADVLWCRIIGEAGPLWIAKYPVTVAQLAAHRRWSAKDAEGRTRTGLEELPQNKPAACIWYEAGTFCSWLSQMDVRPEDAPTDYVLRLPTESEWMLAAGSGAGRYPWGDDWANFRANTAASGLGEPIAVGMYPLGNASSGVADLVGNIWEWCEEDSMPGESVRTGELRMLKGGSALEPPDMCGIHAKRMMRGDVTRVDRGFRVCFGPSLRHGRLQ